MDMFRPEEEKDLKKKEKENGLRRLKKNVKKTDENHKERKKLSS